MKMISLCLFSERQRIIYLWSIDNSHTPFAQAKITPGEIKKEGGDITVEEERSPAAEDWEWTEKTDRKVWELSYSSHLVPSIRKCGYIRTCTQLRGEDTWGLVGFRALKMELLVNGEAPVVENAAAESSAEDPETGLGTVGMEWQSQRT